MDTCAHPPDDAGGKRKTGINAQRGRRIPGAANIHGTLLGRHTCRALEGVRLEMLVGLSYSVLVRDLHRAHDATIPPSNTDVKADTAT